jgi:hypothetical protein
MAGLIKIKRELKPWTVVISGNTWQGQVSKTYHVTRKELQPEAEFFKALVLVKALYDYEFMDDEVMDVNVNRIVRNFADTLNAELAFDVRHLREFIHKTIPYYTVANVIGGYTEEYPTYNITIDIKDGKGQKYDLNYDENDVIDALKTFKLAK